MMSHHRRPTVARTASNEPEDRLSSLPDSIICHILSYVPTKCSAMTSILSRRWRTVFLGVPKIDLDESLVSMAYDRSVEKYNNFLYFVARRLVLSTTAIAEFRLKYQALPNATFNLWLITLLSSSIKVLNVEQMGFPYYSSLCPVSGIFQSFTLVVLKLSGKNIVLKVPEFVSLPNLKVLNVKYLEMQVESDSLRLAEAYPLLEELSLDRIRMKNNRENEVRLEIFLGTLRRLAVILVENRFGRIDIDAPHLTHLQCMFRRNSSSASKLNINMCVCESLLVASLSLISDFHGEDYWFVQILSKAYKLRELYISEGLSQALIFWADFLPLQFPNLTRLEFTGREESMWNLLHRTPNLKAFVCHLVLRNDPENLFPLENVPPCFVRTLKYIRIRGFEFLRPYQIEVVRFFLRHGAVLERMSIEHPYKTMGWSPSILKELLKLKRCSPECEIEVS